MTDKPTKSQDISQEFIMADCMIRVNAIEKLLIDKGLFTQEEYSTIVDTIAKKVADIVMTKAKEMQDKIPQDIPA